MRIGDLGARPIVPVAVHVKPWVETLARVGMAARAVTYLLVGFLAARAALLHRGSPGGKEDALAELLRQPMGKALLIAVGVGLLAYAGWRLVQALLDPERHGTGAKGIAIRIGLAAIGLANGALALVAFRIATGGRGGAEGARTRELGEGVLAQPAGWVLLGAIGAVVIGFGVREIVRGARGSFLRDLHTERMSGTVARWTRRLGGLGLAARGLVLAVLGFFVVRAAFDEDAREIRGLEGALRFVDDHAGTTSLALIGIGLCAYGLYGLVEARHRRIAPL
jgi:hypothetical protein